MKTKRILFIAAIAFLLSESSGFAQFLTPPASLPAVPSGGLNNSPPGGDAEDFGTCEEPDT